MCTKIINDQLTDLFYNFIEMEDRIAANDRYADLNSSDMRFLSAVGKGVLGDDCLIDCSQIPMIYCNYDTQDVVDITLDDLQVGDEIILAIRSSEIENLQKEDDNKAKIAVEQLGTQIYKGENTMQVKISDSIKYIGVDDKTIDLFESQYLVPNGISYNSYLIVDEKVAIMDTVDKRKTDEWLENLDRELNGRTPDYLVISHLEPDHASNIKVVSEKYPSMKLVGNAKTFSMLPQFFPDFDFADKTVTVKEGDELELGSHKLTFIMAPMVHWPEVMVSYESAEKVLFSADGFGTFGALDAQEDDWACEARRYYFNICGKYGVQVQNLLKKAAKLDIRKICPLHGPVLDENLGWYIGLYDTWSKYEPETDGVFIAYCSVHGNTAKAAEKLCEIIKSKTDKKVSIADLSRTDLAEDIEDAFRFSRMVVIAPSYDGGVFPIMNDFLHHLKIKGYKNRKVAMVENGSWAPSAAKTMRTYLEEMKNVEICPTVVTIRSAMKKENIPQLEQLSDEILG